MAFLTRSSTLLKVTPTLKFRLFCDAAVDIGKKGLVLGVFKENKTLVLTSTAKRYNQQTQNKLQKQVELAEGVLKQGKTVVFWGLDGNSEYDAVAVVALNKPSKGFNKSEQLNEELDTVRTKAADGCRVLKNLGFRKIFVESFGHAEAAAEGSILSTWRFQSFKTKKDAPLTISLYPEVNPNADDENTLWNRGVTKASSQNIARRLADCPSNHMTPRIFAEEVTNLFKSSNVNVQIYDKEWAEKQKMGAFLSVTKGSVEPPVFLEITYFGSDKETQPIVLIGKGVTFDSGGISLKPPSNMDEMRADMGGAASLIGTLNAVAQFKFPINLKVLIPLCENMPSGTAIKPGDVIFAKNGKSICVDNTDAEGRLILADALCYSETLNPKFVVDVATLTGAIRIALGNVAAGVFTNDDELYEVLKEAGSNCGDRVWRMPLWSHFSKQVTEHAAYDINNMGKGKGGGSCVAAAFLKEFAPKGKKWMHLDIAGVMGPSDDTPYLSKGMTGRPTRTLIEFLNLVSNK
ncbi:cytosol aminopeptidase-like isoform X2 [Agrilus planipennis]|uniref:Cytosol aminopeptidase n=1 Tax=Agrilus planipennis TaxID=224129 RepID=A0A7F5R1M3_AGRPL|nr:cytosol aminopeptidase-like isoform X2 [Agrilus planipennis]